MKVGELQTLLEGVEEKELEVVLICDYGQSLEHCSGGGFSFVEDMNTCSLEEVHEDDLDGSETKVYVLFT